jgi:3-phenylpropionate/trans-cinnamate dioxygenase ferredoxin subunit
VTRWVDVGAASGVSAKTPLTTEVDGWAIVVVRCEEGYYAVEDRCTHDGEALGGEEVVDCQIVCPRHGARFSLKSGEALTPPAYEPVRTFPLRIEADRILLALPE